MGLCPGPYGGPGGGGGGLSYERATPVGIRSGTVSDLGGELRARFVGLATHLQGYLAHKKTATPLRPP